MAKENGIKLSPVVTSKPARVRTRSQAHREKLREEREQITLWKQPLTTINYSSREFFITLMEWSKQYDFQSFLCTEVSVLFFDSFQNAAA